MPRVKRGVGHVKHRKNILKLAKGYRWGRKKKIKLAKVAVTKAGVHAYFHRRSRKRDMRALWLTKLSAALMNTDISYSQFIGQLKKKNIDLDRKILADLAEHNPKVFEAILQQTK